MNYQQSSKLSAKSQQLQKQRKPTIIRQQQQQQPPSSSTSLKSKCPIPAKRQRPIAKSGVFEARKRKETEEKTTLEQTKTDHWSALKGIKPVAECSKNVKSELTSCLQELQCKRSVYDKRPKPLMAKIINIIAAQDRQCERLEAKRMFEARMQRRKRMMQYHEDEMKSTRNYFEARNNQQEHPKPSLSHEKKVKISSCPNKPKIYQFAMKNTSKSNDKFTTSSNRVARSQKPSIIIPDNPTKCKDSSDSDSALHLLRKFYSDIARSDGRLATTCSPSTDFLELLQRKIDLMFENIHDFEAKTDGNPLNSLDDAELHELIENIEGIL
ncbi:unnamed protein product [Phyllotreta striolata]|uniref:Uncharacterized protein n=1 Tax=Phyllotreta striolata TaxID=444603 RepID=A0A9N9TVE1_PHYSR|nr:unnamed protein product [Phyllotreta striolata]